MRSCAAGLRLTVSLISPKVRGAGVDDVALPGPEGEMAGNADCRTEETEEIDMRQAFQQRVDPPILHRQPYTKLNADPPKANKTRSGVAGASKRWPAQSPLRPAATASFNAKNTDSASMKGGSPTAFER